MLPLCASPIPNRTFATPYVSTPFLSHARSNTLEERSIAAINMVLLGIDERDKRAGPTGNQVEGIDWVIAGHDPCKQVQRRGNVWCIDTRAGFSAMNRLTCPCPADATQVSVVP